MKVDICGSQGFRRRSEIGLIKVNMLSQLYRCSWPALPLCKCCQCSGATGAHEVIMKIQPLSLEVSCRPNADLYSRNQIVQISSFSAFRYSGVGSSMA